MAKVRPIPKGYTSVTPGLSVSGAAAFIAFCRKAFGAKELTRMPMPGQHALIMHAELVIGDAHLMIADEIPGMGNKSAKTLGGTPVNFQIYVADCDKVFKKALAAGATTRMPVQDQFWGDRYGQIEDPFGNLWSVATRKENLTPREMKKRGDAFMKQMQGSGQG